MTNEKNPKKPLYFLCKDCDFECCNKKDYNTQRALVLLVGKRRNQLDYLKSKDIERYRAIIKKLNIRR